MRSQERAAILAAVLAADKQITVRTTPSDLAAAPQSRGAPPPPPASLELRAECGGCTDAKARALAALLQLAGPDLAGPGAPVERAFAAAAAPVDGAMAPAGAQPQPQQQRAGASMRVDAYVTRNGARVAPNAAAFLKSSSPQSDPTSTAALVAAAFEAHPWFVKTAVRKGPVTSCDAPAGAYAFFQQLVASPACPPALHITIDGAAPCAMLAAQAVDRAFGLQRRLGVTAVTAATR